MVLEKNKKGTIIKLPFKVDARDIQTFVNYLKYKQLISESIADDKIANKLANESKSKWWVENKKKFVK